MAKGLLNSCLFGQGIYTFFSLCTSQIIFFFIIDIYINVPGEKVDDLKDPKVKFSL